ncbi:alpha/beta fold hydrolase [Pseudonocardiaceae bacterium YIM PH 21723]|nr:alpha/beta fold hydrolase [Pseudonocardiaceae bacterium YIM PH 21723]
MLVLALSGLPVTAGAQALDWHPCKELAAGWPGTDPATECALLTVPLNHDDPSGRRIEIAVSRLKASEPAKRRGVLLMNPGGPGLPGTTMPERGLGTGLGRLAQEYDLIGFDLRGSGYSSKVTCPVLDEVRPAATEDDAYAQEQERVGRAMEQCADQDRDLVGSMTTLTMARDMDAIRRALGEKTISYYGISWGSALGLTYRGVFDSQVDRMLLDSVTVPGQYFDRARDRSAAVEELATEFFGWLAQRDAGYHFGGSAAAVRTALLDLRGRTDGDRVDQLLGSAQPNWSAAADELAAIRDGKAGKAVTVTSPGNLFVHYAVYCNDSSAQRSPAKDPSATRRWRTEFPVAGYRSFPPETGGVCGHWPFASRPVTPGKGYSSLQLVGHRWESITPFGWARSAQQAVGGALLTVPDAQHGSFGNLDCAQRGVDFLTGGAAVSGDC